MPVDRFRVSFATLLMLLLAGCASVAPPEPGATSETATATPQAVVELPLQQALLAAHPRTGNPARARALLEATLAATDDASRALHPYARTLLDQVVERQRLDAANVKLVQQLERSGQQLKDSQQQAEDLQRKMDALADIERSQSARSPRRSLNR
jgi:hypothetical protein